MTDLLRSWVLGMTGAAVFCAVATHLTPRGKVKYVVRLLCGVVMASAMLSPLLEPDLADYGLNLAKYRAAAQTLTGQAEELRQSLDRTVIEEKMQAYILDKAHALEAEVTAVRVTLKWSTQGFWYPTAAELQGPYHADLSRALEADLGIPAQAQTWRTNENP